MLKKIKTKLQQEDNKRLLSNFISLSSIQLISYLLPLITVPYLVRVLGAEKFGLVIFAQVVVQYFVIFLDYGFGLTGTKQIAENRNSSQKISEIFSAIFFIRIVILLISFFILCILIFGLNFYEKEWKLFMITFGIAIGHGMFPVYFFQGIEKMKITALINIIPKIIFTIFIFLFIQDSNDYLNVAIINSLGFLIAGIFSLYFTFFKFNVKFKLPSYENIIFQLKEGWYVFIGSVSANFSLLSIPFLLGVFSTTSSVGYYSAVEKIIRPLTSIVRPVINSIFPHIVSKINTEFFKINNFYKKITFVSSLIMLVIGIILFTYADLIITILFGNDFVYSINILKIMSFIPFLHSLLHIYIIPMMIILEIKQIYSKVLFLSFITLLIFSSISIKIFDVIGASWSILIYDLSLVFILGVILQGRIKNAYEKV